MQGIFVDSLGNIAEGPNMNVAILTKQGEFVVSLLLVCGQRRTSPSCQNMECHD